VAHPTVGPDGVRIEDETANGLPWVRVTAPDGRAGVACVAGFASRAAAIAAVVRDLEASA
jgi:hypothetical protein